MTPPAPTPDSAPAATWDGEGLLARLDGDARLAAECAEIFCVDASRRLLALTWHCSRGDLPSIARELHSLKGAAGTAGAIAFQQAAHEAERAAAGQDVHAVTRLVAVMDEELPRIRAAVLTFGTTA